MEIFLNFICSISLFMYGIHLFSSSLTNLAHNKIKIMLEKYTKTPIKGIIFGTIATAIIQSSTVVTIMTVGLVNSNIITFFNSIGIMMGANLGTCITSWILSLMGLNNSNLLLDFLSPITYIPLFLLLGIILINRKRTTISNILIGFALFLLGFKNMQEALIPLANYPWFTNLLVSLSNPILGILTGIIVTTIIQSSSATVGLLQSLSISNKLTFMNTIPIIMGENIGSCITTLIASINVSKNAKKVAYSHLLYNILGTVFFLILFYLTNYFMHFTFIDGNVNPTSIAIIHTLFNLFSIIVFYPFIGVLEKSADKLVN